MRDDVLCVFDEEESTTTCMTPEYPGYWVYEDGRVFSCWSNKFLKQWYTCDGNARQYRRSKLRNVHGKYISIPVHQLVALAFLGPAHGRQVNHKDGDKENNHRSNLEYVSHRENLYHAMETGLHACSFRDTILVDPAGKKHKVRNVTEFCRKHKLQQPNINKVLRGLRKHHKGWTGYYENSFC